MPHGRGLCSQKHGPVKVNVVLTACLSLPGLTPLCVSVLNNYTDIALRLLSHSTDCINVCDCRNNLPLHYAVRNGNTQLVTSLLEAGELFQCL